MDDRNAKLKMRQIQIVKCIFGEHLFCSSNDKLTFVRTRGRVPYLDHTTGQLRVFCSFFTTFQSPQVRNDASCVCHSESAADKRPVICSFFTY